jgi:hypothetical protein
MSGPTVTGRSGRHDRTSDVWEADVYTCPGCYQLDDMVERMKHSRGSTKGQSVRMFRSGD